MKHTAPNFWQFVAGYVLLGAGTLLVVGEMLEWGMMNKRPALLVGIVAIWFGVFTLTVLKNPSKKDDA